MWDVLGDRSHCACAFISGQSHSLILERIARFGDVTTGIRHFCFALSRRDYRSRLEE